MKIVFIGFLAAAQAHAGDLGGGSPAAPALELGYKIFNGPNVVSGTAGNLQGSKAYLLLFRAENRRNLIRVHAAAQFEYASGTSPITAPTAADAYTMYGASFLPGFYLYPFRDARMQPFIGASGIAGWYTMKLSNAYTQSLSFGYEVGAGVDLRFGGGGGRLLRVRSAFTNHSASLGGNTQGVNMNAFLISLGLPY
ncbi:MAG: hypothetical protein KGQ59_07105 [Bdellovibrionales bacterium]|nr:hypothetical protein [Bdellovibrionales bacterium]